jgi:hypothetical protein
MPVAMAIASEALLAVVPTKRAPEGQAAMIAASASAASAISGPNGCERHG